jgi:exonuclease 3'-5' domain-containing protein 1
MSGEDPGHKAMLYFLEVLMNSNGPLTISQMAGRFGSRSFSAEMRVAAGGNEVGLKKFLLKYPSLFTVVGNMVSLFDSSKPVSSPAVSEGSSGGGGMTPSGRSLPDVSEEMEAVRYFQNKLSKKEEQWIPVKSLAGHLSQAPENTRNLVGPQLDFRKWLLKHPHIFEVQGELVGLRDGVAAVATPSIIRRSFDLNGTIPSSPIPSVRMFPPKTPPASRKFPQSPAAVRRSHSFGDRRTNQAALQDTSPLVLPPGVLPTTPVAKRRNAPVTMTANEYKAVMFLKDIVEKRGGIRLHNITGHFSQAPEGVRNTIGWTKMELEEFLKKNAYVFYVSEDEVVSVIKNAKMNVIITGSRPQGQSVRTLSGRHGKVFHVAKLWGIIDLGKHEHVFFDKSIMRSPLDDMQKDFKLGEILWFNAVVAPKTSRAKWRATHVWREHETPFPGIDSGFSFSDGGGISPAVSIEEEINRFLPLHDIDDADKYLDALQSSAGTVPVWSSKEQQELEEDLHMMSENSFMSSSALNDLRLKFNHAIYTSSESSSDDRFVDQKLDDDSPRSPRSLTSPRRLTSPRSMTRETKPERLATPPASAAATPAVISAISKLDITPISAATAGPAPVKETPIVAIPAKPVMSTPKVKVAAPASASAAAPVVVKIEPGAAAAASPAPTSNGIEPKTSPASVVNHASPVTTVKRYATVSCQTISTGEIIATQLYQE